MLRTLSDKKRRFFYLQQMGQPARVLFENDIEEGRMHGFTENYIRVAAPYDPALINRVVQVRLEGMTASGSAVIGSLYETEPAG